MEPGHAHSRRLDSALARPRHTGINTIHDLCCPRSLFPSPSQRPTASRKWPGGQTPSQSCNSYTPPSVCTGRTGRGPRNATPDPVAASRPGTRPRSSTAGYFSALGQSTSSRFPLMKARPLLTRLHPRARPSVDPVGPCAHLHTTVSTAGPNGTHLGMPHTSHTAAKIVPYHSTAKGSQAGAAVSGFQCHVHSRRH
ncbi:hypothetical protein BGZ61DRAFT_113169 [Ilyonectria robusta]|uniref:uncharacterized protein n=1 Tax=Ilyonectria robusta TaxID=1079257 RepID=UPI001E8DBAE4|nr:uncharacterized protein BGZ61DRAFT_113169 [Ilyonectria robusta]KAH8669987.1 hypothetical protein BGZ61DRAFT_113169 [Ilyonectria robusta]